jgi:hypothetical protein
VGAASNTAAPIEEPVGLGVERAAHLLAQGVEIADELLVAPLRVLEGVSISRYALDGADEPIPDEVPLEFGLVVPRLQGGLLNQAMGALAQDRAICVDCGEG